ncbi:MAG: nitrate reductase molybdenum cofactor assembly chaperone [Chloroflexi bacterium]|nr:nitrate reductase molybdenum cofactor assembly chaperone [Chloroflexota bacterium]
MQQICDLFARVIDYPAASLREAAGQCAALLQGVSPDAAASMRSFQTFVESQPLETLEELYTQTFDVSAAAALYTGYHLFGDSPKRSQFMARLQENYELAGLSGGGELPDHAGMILRFLPAATAAEFVTPLLRECLLPVLERIESALRKDKNPYGSAIHSLRVFLEHFSRNLLKTGGLQHA